MQLQLMAKDLWDCGGISLEAARPLDMKQPKSENLDSF